MRAKSQKAQQEGSFRFETANEKSAGAKMREKYAIFSSLLESGGASPKILICDFKTTDYFIFNVQHRFLHNRRNL
jgi:hypothetical protein